MPNSSFAFKQFTIKQDKCAMKVGTDAVLFGAWVTVDPAVTHILDIGTGTGVIALMMAQKSTVPHIDAIDIDENACIQAGENTRQSPWKDRIQIHPFSLQKFADANPNKKYELIVSNPPYFIDSSKASEEARTTARHAYLLPFEELISGIKKLLHPDGKFCVILPSKEGEIFLNMAEANKLYLVKLTRVRTRADKASEKRLMMQFELKRKSFSEDSIAIEKDDIRGNYTEEYKELTKDFYLNF